MAPDKHPNDDYINPVSATSAPPPPPAIFPDELAEQRAASQGGEIGDGGSGGTPPSSDPAADDTRSLDELHVDELRERAKALGVEGAASKKKDDLIAAIRKEQRS